MTKEEHIKYWRESADFNLQTRYTDYKLEFYKMWNQESAKENLVKIKEFYTWFESQIK
jgi:hypothetical protein